MPLFLLGLGRGDRFESFIYKLRHKFCEAQASENKALHNAIRGRLLGVQGHVVGLELDFYPAEYLHPASGHVPLGFPGRRHM